MTAQPLPAATSWPLGGCIAGLIVVIGRACLVIFGVYGLCEARWRKV